jgi:NADPH-dependent ferric siderophore reductase
LTGVAGDKAQIKMDGGIKARTYTPITWDNDRGMVELLAYCHGHGHGSAWAASAQPGAEHQLLGPRSSLSLEGIGGEAVFFGDETSIALAAAFSTTLPGHRIHHVLKASDKAEVHAALDHLRLVADVGERQADDGHLDALMERMAGLAKPDTVFILSGKASSIQRCTHMLKAAKVPASRLRVKAYWAPGMD